MILYGFILNTILPIPIMQYSTFSAGESIQLPSPADGSGDASSLGALALPPGSFLITPGNMGLQGITLPTVSAGFNSDQIIVNLPISQVQY